MLHLHLKFSLKSKVVFILFFTLFYSLILCSQPEHLFEIVNDNTGLLNAQEKITAKKLKEGQRFVQGWTVALAKIEKSKDLKATIKLPGIGQSLDLISNHSFEMQQGQLFGNSKFTVWGGKVKGAKKKGEFLLVRSEYGSIGCIMQFNGQVFEILPVNAKAGVLRKVNPNYSKGRNCQVGSNSFQGGNYNSSNFNITCSPCQSMCTQSCTKRRWKILVGWTDDAVRDLIDTYGWYTQTMFFYPIMMNATFLLSLQNSKITNIPEIEYIDINIGDSWNPSGNDFSEGLNNARRLGRSLRSTYNHDRFVVITSHDYTAISGVADFPYSRFSGAYDSDKDAAVVEYQTVFYPELTFAHELGHTFGAHHDDVFTGSPNLVDCYRGFIFGNGGIDRTVMATLYTDNSVPSSSSAMVFSGPNNTYEYNGQQVPIGNAGRNNKNVVEYTLCYEGVDPQSAQEEVYARFLTNNEPNNNTIIYPNPVKSFINIQKSDNLKWIEVISIAGRIVKTIKLESEVINNLDVDFLESGAYFLRLKYPDLVKTVKFIKQ